MNPNTLLINIENAIVRPLIALFGVLAVLLFVWGLFKFIKNPEDKTAKEEGQKHMMYGILGLAIMFGAKGIVAIISNLF